MTDITIINLELTVLSCAELERITSRWHVDVLDFMISYLSQWKNDTHLGLRSDDTIFYIP